MTKLGMDEMRLLDGNCICDALVEAPAEKLAAAFGKPIKLAEGGRALIEKPRSDIVFFAASFPGLSWSVVEAVPPPEYEDDYIVTLLRQADAALRGTVLKLSPSYENGLGVAKEAALAVKARAVCVWGSDEWSGLGGGAEIGSNGEIVRACNVSDLPQIKRELVARERMIAGEDDEEGNSSSSETGGQLFVFQPGTGISAGEGPVIEFLDRWFKELKAAQPTSPPSLWGVWENYSEVWGAF